MFQSVNSYSCQIECVFKFSVFMDGFVHVEGSFVEEGEGLDEPEEHLCSGSVNHNVLKSVPFCSDSGIQESHAKATSDAEATLIQTRHRRACSRPAATRSSVCPQSHHQ